MFSNCLVKHCFPAFIFFALCFGGTVLQRCWLCQIIKRGRYRGLRVIVLHQTDFPAKFPSPHFWMFHEAVLSVSSRTTSVTVNEIGLRFVPVVVITIIISFVICVLALNVPFYKINEHKKLDSKFGAPIVFVIILFCFVVIGYIQMTKNI